MENQFIFSELKIDKLNETLSLVREVFLEYEAPDYSDEGVEEFMRFIESKAIKEMLSEKIMRIWTCENDGIIIGMLAGGIKEGKNHIFLLFVDKRYHRKGIARQLLNMMTEQSNPSEIRVNSSPYAVEVYRRLGFSDIDTEQTVNGLRFTPMISAISGGND